MQWNICLEDAPLNKFIALKMKYMMFEYYTVGQIYQYKGKRFLGMQHPTFQEKNDEDTYVRSQVLAWKDIDADILNLL